MNEETLFTTSAVLDLLSQVDELADKNIDLIEGEDNLKLNIGESSYDIPLNTSEEVEVPEEVVDQVADINDEAFDNLETSGVEITDEEVVEGGIIKEALKTLAIGGLVRLTGKLVGKDIADALK